jgi:toxin ParE1/3/4
LRRLAYARAAREDLDAIIAHIALDDPAAAERVYRRIAETADRLTDFPNLGHIGRLSGTREFGVAGLPYLIVYQVAADAVTVLAVLHAARDLARAFAERRKTRPRR